MQGLPQPKQHGTPPLSPWSFWSLVPVITVFSVVPLRQPNNYLCTGSCSMPPRLRILKGCWVPDLSLTANHWGWTTALFTLMLLCWLLLKILHSVSLHVFGIYNENTKYIVPMCVVCDSRVSGNTCLKIHIWSMVLGSGLRLESGNVFRDNVKTESSDFQNEEIKQQRRSQKWLLHFECLLKSQTSNLDCFANKWRFLVTGQNYINPFWW